MPFPVCLQDWVTVKGVGGATVLQQKDTYVDVSGYQDLAFYVEIASNSNATLYVQTAPTYDEMLFQYLKNNDGSNLSWSGSGVVPFLLANAYAPYLPARLLRWLVTGSSNWSATFRIWLSLNQAPGSG